MATNSIGKRIIGTQAGQNAIFVQSNSDNTSSSSHANILARVAGSSAGDAFSLYTSGSMNYSEGVDNSDSDAYVQSYGSTLGTNNILRVEPSNNQIRMPLQSSFGANKDAASTNVTGDGTEYLVASYDDIFWNTGSNLDASSGKYTCPKNGMYQFTCWLVIEDLTSSHTDGIVRFRKFSPSGEVLVWRANIWLYAITGGAVALELSACRYFESGNEVGVTLQVSNGTKVVDITSARFYGYLIA